MKLLVKNIFAMPDYASVVAEMGAVSCYLDYHFVDDIKRERGEAQFVKNIVAAGVDGDTWVATQGGVLKGLLCMQPIPWDSSVLGCPAFKISRLEGFNASGDELDDVLDALLCAALASIGGLSRVHCHVRIPRVAGAMANALGKRGFNEVEHLNTYGARLSDIGSALEGNKVMPVETRFVVADDIDWARQVSRETVNPYDRFHADKFLAESADQFMEEWVSGCTSGFCDTNFIALSEQHRAGFALWQSGRDEKKYLGVQLAKLALGAVARPFSGLGIHRTLVARGCQHFVEQGADWVLMSTQEENKAAIHSMTVLGWSLLYREATWSWWLGGQRSEN